MSPFIIFVIVLTLGYVLYYGAMIATDLTAQAKKQGDESETISTGEEDDDFTHTAKSVYEDPENGGFGFTTENPVEEPSSIIQEEAEETIDEVPEATTDDEQGNIQGGQETEIPGSEEPESTPEDNIEETTQEPSEPDSTEKPDDDDDDGLTTVEYVEDKEEKKEEFFDVNQAFDPSLTQPKFGVSKVIEPAASLETQQKANDVNDALEPIKRLGNQHKPLVLAHLMKNKELSEQHNLDTTDEVNKQ